MRALGGADHTGGCPWGRALRLLVGCSLLVGKRLAAWCSSNTARGQLPTDRLSHPSMPQFPRRAGGHSWRSSVSCAQPVRDTERRSSVGQTRVQPPRGLSQNPRAAPQWPRVPVAAPRGRCAAGRAHACRVQPPGGSIPAEALSPRLSKRRAEPGPPRGERPASHPGFQAASEKEKNPERLVTQPATRL